MKHSCLNSKWILFIFFHGILLLFMSSSLKSARILAFADESDRLALLDFKNQIRQDPLQIMSLWNDSTHFCNWFGVTCSPSSKRVVVLNLQAQRLAGPIAPSMGNLTYLTGINLGNNSMYSEIPQEVGRLRRLKHLNLSSNSFGGNLPTNLSYCTQLRVLAVDANNLVGQIPEQFSALSKLVYLNLGRNNLTGTIPAWIGNISSLYFLVLQQNNLQGSIPSELGRLSSLGVFGLAENNLSEYGMGGQVSVLGDIYSYGILLLEMFTGKRPTDDMFKDGMSIHKFMAMALPERVMDVVDSSMPFEESEEDADDETNNDVIEEGAIIEEVDRHFNARSKVEDCLVSVLQIGLLCSATSPHERLPTTDVVNKLRAIRDAWILTLSSVHHRG